MMRQNLSKSDLKSLIHSEETQKKKYFSGLKKLKKAFKFSKNTCSPDDNWTYSPCMNYQKLPSAGSSMISVPSVVAKDSEEKKEKKEKKSIAQKAKSFLKKIVGPSPKKVKKAVEPAPTDSSAEEITLLRMEVLFLSDKLDRQENAIRLSTRRVKHLEKELERKETKIAEIDTDRDLLCEILNETWKRKKMIKRQHHLDMQRSRRIIDRQEETIEYLAAKLQKKCEKIRQIEERNQELLIQLRNSRREHGRRNLNTEPKSSLHETPRSHFSDAAHRQYKLANGMNYRQYII